MLKILLIAIISMAIMNSCSQNCKKDCNKHSENSVPMQNMLSDKEKSDGWKLLFDGKTANGWHTYGQKVASSAWKVVDGELQLDDSNKKEWQIVDGGDIVTEEEFGNFNLQLDWKIDTGGNSGIMMFAQEDTSKYKWAYETGLEMQILDNKAHHDASIFKHRAGDLYDLIACSTEVAKPALEWNHVEITSLDGKLEFFLNGTKVVSTMLWDDNWKKMLAASKFKDMPDFGTFKKGKIALQDHGNKVWYRNIKIKTL